MQKYMHLTLYKYPVYTKQKFPTFVLWAGMMSLIRKPEVFPYWWKIKVILLLLLFGWQMISLNNWRWGRAQNVKSPYFWGLSLTIPQRVKVVVELRISWLPEYGQCVVCTEAMVTFCKLPYGLSQPLCRFVAASTVRGGSHMSTLWLQV